MSPVVRWIPAVVVSFWPSPFWTEVALAERQRRRRRRAGHGDAKEAGGLIGVAVGRRAEHVRVAVREGRSRSRIAYRRDGAVDRVARRRGVGDDRIRCRDVGGYSENRCDGIGDDDEKCTAGRSGRAGDDRRIERIERARGVIAGDGGGRAIRIRAARRKRDDRAGRARRLRDDDFGQRQLRSAARRTADDRQRGRPDLPTRSADVVRVQGQRIGAGGREYLHGHEHLEQRIGARIGVDAERAGRAAEDDGRGHGGVAPGQACPADAHEFLGAAGIKGLRRDSADRIGEERR